MRDESLKRQTYKNLADVDKMLGDMSGFRLFSEILRLLFLEIFR